MPLHRRLPKRGFNNIFAKKYNELNLGRVQAAIDSGRLDGKKPITVEALKEAGLIRRAKDAGKIEAGFELPRECRDNSPERIARALAPAREQGLIPPFPFGTDFTAAEQRLIPALRLLGSASALRRARLAVRGLLSGAASPEAQDCLARMGLDKRASPADHLYAALLRGALASLPAHRVW